MSTVVLDHVFNTGIQNPTSLVSRVQAIDLYELPPPSQGLLALLGFSITSDVTAVVGGLLKRTITLQTTAFGDSIYGGSATKIKDATRNLFRNALGMRTPSIVTAAEPVVS